MGGGREHRPSVRLTRVRAVRAFSVFVVVLVLLGIASSLLALPQGILSSPRGSAALSVPQNGSSGSDPPASAAGLCPSSGPVVLGVQWNCVAVLNLTELVLILTSIGIVAYVFKDADRAELPGDSAEVPITSEELAEYRRAKRLGIPYHPPGPPAGKTER